MMIDPPPNRGAVVNQNGEPNSPFAAFFTQVFTLCFDVANSGITASRPTRNMYVGKQYFDTTIGKPIWWNGSIWVKSDGTAA